MLGTDYPDNTLPDDDGASFLTSVTPVLAAADIAFGNLEGVLMDGGEAVKRCRPARATAKGSRATPPPPPAPSPPPADAAHAAHDDAVIAAVPVEDDDDDKPADPAAAPA